MSSLVFVYGTLKRGGALHYEMIASNARFLGSARVQGELFHIKGESWPGAFHSTSGKHVQGELYKLLRPAKAFKKLDRIEGCPEGLFTRKLVDAWKGNDKVRAWAYFCNLEAKKGSRIPNGDFTTQITSHRRT